MSTDTFKRLSRCGIDNCKATLYYVQDGQWFCKNGHLRVGEFELDEDDELQANTQTGAKAKKAVDQQKQPPAKLLHGKRGFELFLRCIQLILRKQTHILIHHKGFPAQFEAVIRGLWILRLQKSLGACKSVASTVEDQADEIGWASEETNCFVTTDTETYSSEYLSSDADVDNALSAENDQAKKRQLRRIKRSFRPPGLMVTLALCYLAAIMLRIPISLGDLHRWVDSQDIPYTLALQEIPENMKQPLNATYIKALRPTHRLNPTDLRRKIEDLVALYTSQFDIIFPELNWPVLTLKFVRDLGLPSVEVYGAVKRLVQILQLTFHLDGLSGLRRPLSEWPEARLMSLVLIATKLAWGLDTFKRLPRSNTEAAAVSPHPKSWESFLAEKKKQGDSVYDYTDMDVLNLSGEELDEYMDWYARTWLLPQKGSVKTRLQDYLLNMFPIHEVQEQRNPGPERVDFSMEKLQKLNSNVELKECAKDRTLKFTTIGQGYPLWRKGRSLPPRSKMIVDAASAVICISRDDMITALRQLEVTYRDSEWLKTTKYQAKKGT